MVRLIEQRKRYISSTINKHFVEDFPLLKANKMNSTALLERINKSPLAKSHWSVWFLASFRNSLRTTEFQACDTSFDSSRPVGENPPGPAERKRVLRELCNFLYIHRAEEGGGAPSCNKLTPLLPTVDYNWFALIV